MATVDSPLDIRVQQSLRTCYESLLKSGQLLPKDRLAQCYFKDCPGSVLVQNAFKVWMVRRC